MPGGGPYGAVGDCTLASERFRLRRRPSVALFRWRLPLGQKWRENRNEDEKKKWREQNALEVELIRYEGGTTAREKQIVF